ncbi:MAG: protein kinase [Pirellulales bacterium]
MNDSAMHNESPSDATPLDDSLHDDSRLGDLVDEFAARWQAGEIGNTEEFIRANAPYAEALRRLLPTVQVMAELGDAAARPQPRAFERLSDATDESGPRTLGDFRIVREIGRGGMGVVYEAVQLSLDRRVALKVLPFAATLDDRHLQRFKNEAQAAAHLHHSHIVPVFAVGCERGVHYYAMQFIEGESLSAVVAELRINSGDRGLSASFVSDTLQSSDRTSFYRSIARLGAQAAEALAYAHRLGVIHRDIKPANILVERPGHLWIADFGLARIEADANLTATGDIVGTLRYMSPEQALGRRELIDHRTDIYSLGATMYELLTLEPVFAADTRRSLLRQVAEDDPCPPRRVAASVPQELETITLKALGKRPVDRYASAQELADDLNRFLRDEPIRARRPGLRQRTLKWMRRHRAVVTTAGICLLLSIVAMAGTVGWAVRDRAARAAAAGREIDDAVAQTRRLIHDGDAMSAATELQRAERIAATGNVGEPVDEIEALKLEIALLKQLEDARLLRGEGANIGIEHGYLDYRRADAAYAAAFSRLGADFARPLDDGVVERWIERPIRPALAAALDDWALVRMAGDGGEASWRRMIAVASRLDSDAQRTAVREAVLRSDDEALLDVARSDKSSNLPPQTALLVAAALIERRWPKDAVALLKSVQRRRPDDFWVNYTLACCYLRWLYNEDEGLRFAAVAVGLRPDLPAPHLLLGHTLAELERPEDGLAEAREALRLKPDYAGAHMFVCRTLGELGRFDEAVAAGREAVRLEPRTPAILRWVAKTMAAAGHSDEAVELLRDNLRLDPNDEWAHCLLARTFAAQGLWNDALAEYEATLRLNPMHQDAYDGLGDTLTRLGRLDAAEAARRRAIDLVPNDAERYVRLANLLSARGKWSEAWDKLRSGLEIWFVAATRHFRRGDYFALRGDDDFAVNEYRLALRYRPNDRETHLHLAETLRRLGRRDEAIQAYRAGLEPRAENFQGYVELGILLVDRGDVDDAVVALAEAHRLVPQSRRAQSHYGHALCRQGQIEQGIAQLRDVLARDANYALAIEFQAEAEGGAGNIETSAPPGKSP